MRTTITIPEDLLKEARQLSGQSGYSAAIVTSLQDYVSLKKRLALLNRLLIQKVPHSWGVIKKLRHKRQWSS